MCEAGGCVGDFPSSLSPKKDLRKNTANKFAVLDREMCLSKP